MTKTVKRVLIATLGLMFLLATSLFVSACVFTGYTVSLEYDDTQGTVSLTPEKSVYALGDEVTVTVEPFKGFEVDTFTVNGTPEVLTEGQYTLDVVKTTKIAVTFKEAEVVDSRSGLTVDDVDTEWYSPFDDITVAVDADGYVQINGEYITLEEQMGDYYLTGDYETSISFSGVFAFVSHDDFYGYVILKDSEEYTVNSALDGTWTGGDFTVDVADGKVTVNGSETFVFYGYEDADSDVYTYYLLADDHMVYQFDGSSIYDILNEENTDLTLEGDESDIAFPKDWWGQRLKAVFSTATTADRYYEIDTDGMGFYFYQSESINAVVKIVSKNEDGSWTTTLVSGRGFQEGGVIRFESENVVLFGSMPVAVPGAAPLVAPFNLAGTTWNTAAFENTFIVFPNADSEDRSVELHCTSVNGTLYNYPANIWAVNEETGEITLYDSVSANRFTIVYNRAQDTLEVTESPKNGRLLGTYTREGGSVTTGIPEEFYGTYTDVNNFVKFVVTENSIDSTFFGDHEVISADNVTFDEAENTISFVQNGYTLTIGYDEETSTWRVTYTNVLTGNSIALNYSESTDPDEGGDEDGDKEFPAKWVGEYEANYMGFRLYGVKFAADGTFTFTQDGNVQTAEIVAFTDNGFKFKVKGDAYTAVITDESDGKVTAFTATDDEEGVIVWNFTRIDGDEGGEDGPGDEKEFPAKWVGTYEDPDHSFVLTFDEDGTFTLSQGSPTTAEFGEFTENGFIFTWNGNTYTVTITAEDGEHVTAFDADNTWYIAKFTRVGTGGEDGGEDGPGGEDNGIDEMPENFIGSWSGTRSITREDYKLDIDADGITVSVGNTTYPKITLSEISGDATALTFEFNGDTWRLLSYDAEALGFGPLNSWVVSLYKDVTDEVEVNPDFVGTWKGTDSNDFDLEITINADGTISGVWNGNEINAQGIELGDAKITFQDWGESGYDFTLTVDGDTMNVSMEYWFEVVATATLTREAASNPGGDEDEDSMFFGTWASDTPDGNNYYYLLTVSEDGVLFERMRGGKPSKTEAVDSYTLTKTELKISYKGAYYTVTIGEGGTLILVDDDYKNDKITLTKDGEVEETDTIGEEFIGTWNTQVGASDEVELIITANSVTWNGQPATFAVSDSVFTITFNGATYEVNLFLVEGVISVTDEQGDYFICFRSDAVSATGISEDLCGTWHEVDGDRTIVVTADAITIDDHAVFVLMADGTMVYFVYQGEFFTISYDEEDGFVLLDVEYNEFAFTKEAEKPNVPFDPNFLGIWKYESLIADYSLTINSVNITAKYNSFEEVVVATSEVTVSEDGKTISFAFNSETWKAVLTADSSSYGYKIALTTGNYMADLEYVGPAAEPVELIPAAYQGEYRIEDYDGATQYGTLTLTYNSVILHLEYDRVINETDGTTEHVSFDGTYTLTEEDVDGGVEQGVAYLVSLSFTIDETGFKVSNAYMVGLVLAYAEDNSALIGYLRTGEAGGEDGGEDGEDTPVNIPVQFQGTWTGNEGTILIIEQNRIIVQRTSDSNAILIRQNVTFDGYSLLTFYVDGKLCYFEPDFAQSIDSDYYYLSGGWTESFTRS